MENYPLNHLKISTGNLSEIFTYIQQKIQNKEPCYCIPINLTKYVVAKKDSKLQKAILKSEVVIADGIPIVWMGKKLGHDVARVTGIDLAEKILCESQTQGWKVFFLGAKPEYLQEAVVNCRERFHNPNIVGTQDGYFQESDVPEIIKKIQAAQPDILLLGLGMPQKEYFVHDHFEQLQIPFCLTVGGAFDIWAGAKIRTPRWIQRIGFEWLYRSVYDKSKALNIVKYGWIFLQDLLWVKK